MLKLSHETLTDRAYAALKKALTAGDFPPGHALVIRAVAETYGISQTPIREALQRLVAERMLTLQPNRSIIVPYLSVARFEELTRIRCALEGLAADLATRAMTTDRTDMMRSIALEIEGAMKRKNIHDYVHLNRGFHFALYERACSPILMQMIEDLWCQVGPFFTRLFDDPGYLPYANDHHYHILAQLDRRDPAGARDATCADINAAAAVLIPQLERDTGSSEADQS